MNRDTRLAERVQALVSTQHRIAATGMRGLPLLHPGLAVAAVGFDADADGMATGVLVTPWSMNLVRLPLHEAAAAGVPAVGQTRSHTLAGRAFDFIGSHGDPVGAYEACSLFSPMLQFADQAAARATAQEVLRLLREEAATASRRGFLQGRPGMAAGASVP